MASLVQYAEAEAVLKNVHADCDILESNLKMIERSRQDREIYSTMGRSLHDHRSVQAVSRQKLVWLMPNSASLMQFVVLSP